MRKEGKESSCTLKTDPVAAAGIFRDQLSLGILKLFLSFPFTEPPAS